MHKKAQWALANRRAVLAIGLGVVALSLALLVPRFQGPVTAEPLSTNFVPASKNQGAKSPEEVVRRSNDQALTGYGQAAVAKSYNGTKVDWELVYGGLHEFHLYFRSQSGIMVFTDLRASDRPRSPGKRHRVSGKVGYVSNYVDLEDCQIR